MGDNSGKLLYNLRVRIQFVKSTGKSKQSSKELEAAIRGVLCKKVF